MAPSAVIPEAKYARSCDLVCPTVSSVYLNQVASNAAGFLIPSRIGPIRPVVAKAHFSRIAVRPQSPCGRLKIFAHQPW